MFPFRSGTLPRIQYSWLSIIESSRLYRLWMYAHKINKGKSTAFNCLFSGLNMCIFVKILKALRKRSRSVLELRSLCFPLMRFLIKIGLFLAELFELPEAFSGASWVRNFVYLCNREIVMVMWPYFRLAFPTTGSFLAGVGAFNLC